MKALVLALLLIGCTEVSPPQTGKPGNGPGTDAQPPIVVCVLLWGGLPRCYRMGR